MYRNYAIEGKRIHDFLDGNGPVPAHHHPNGGGWVADSAKVSDTAYVGKQGRVFGNAQVLGFAQILDAAEVSGNAIVRGYAKVCGRSRVQGHAIIQDGVTLRDSAFVATNLQLGGDAVVDDSLTLVSYNSCMGCPFMPRDTYGVVGENPCMNCMVGIMRREKSGKSSMVAQGKCSALKDARVPVLDSASAGE